MNGAPLLTHIEGHPAVAPEIVIEVEGLTKSFGGRPVVKNLTMQVRKGLIYGWIFASLAPSSHIQRAPRKRYQRGLG